MSTDTGKARSANTMEFTVSKSDLVRELNLSQGVVEKKTTKEEVNAALKQAADSGPLELMADITRTDVGPTHSRMNATVSGPGRARSATSSAPMITSATINANVSRPRSSAAVVLLAARITSPAGT